MMYSCSRCGKVHEKGRCNKPLERDYSKYNSEDRTLRSSYAWTVKALEIKEKANYLCEVCRDNNTYTYDNLEVHHIEKVRERKDLLLENTNLIVLCQLHHKEADKGRIQKEYLKELAEAREKK